MDDRDYKLILLVQQHQHIYDKNSYYFKDKNAVEASWKLIAASLNTSEDDCQRRWCVLRNRYAKYRREEGKPEARKKPWPLVDALTFLEAHVKRRRSYRTVSDTQAFGTEQHILPDNPILSKPEKWEEIIIDEDDEDELDQDVKVFHSDHSNASSEDNPIKQLPKCLEVQRIPKIISSTALETNLKDVEIIRIHENKRTENTVNEIGVEEKNGVDDKTQINGVGSSSQINFSTPDDSLLHFCLSLHQSMKHLPKKYITKAKIEILQVIDKYEIDD